MHFKGIGKVGLAGLLWLGLSQVMLAQPVLHGGALGGTKYDYGKGICRGAGEEAYVVGEFRDSADVDPGPGVYRIHAAKYQDIFLSKYNDQGVLQWAFAIGDTFKTDTARGVAFGPDGNVVIAGQFTGTIDADPGPGTNVLVGVADTIQWNSFFAKYDATGHHLWAKRIGNPGQMAGIQHVEVDAQGAIFMVGSFTGTVDFDPGPGQLLHSSGVSTAGWMGKYDANGNVQWVAPFFPSGTNKAVAVNMVQDSYGNVFVTGYFTGTVDLDPGPGTFSLTSPSFEDAFLAKLTSSGQLEWAFRIGGNGHQMGTAVAYDGAGGIYLGGDITGTVDFDPSPGNDIRQSGSVTGSYNGFLAHYDSSGAYHWIAVFTADTMSRVVNIRSDSARGVVVGLNFQGRMDYDPTTSIQYAYSFQSDAFLVRIGATARYNWGGAIGGPYMDKMADMDYSPSGRVFHTGSISGTVDLDLYPTTYMVTASGGSDAYFGMNEVCAPTLGATYSGHSCGFYYWLLTGMAFNESGIYYKIWPNSRGCDSTITLYVRLDEIDTTVTAFPGQLLAVNFADQYQWLDCNNGMTPVPGATGALFTPTAVGSYAVAITMGSCIDTSACHTISGLGASDLQLDLIGIGPNPNDGSFRIIGNLEGLEIDVLDAMGRSVASMRSESVALDGLSRGIYWVRFRGAEGRQRVIPIFVDPRK